VIFNSLSDFAKESFAAGWPELIGTLLQNFVESNKPSMNEKDDSSCKPKTAPTV